MAKVQRLRETLSGSPTLEYLSQKAESGWKLIALEWERQIEQDVPEVSPQGEEIPYGVQVAEDCSRLVENPAEMRILMIALNMIVDDHPMSRVADELNARGYRTRKGEKWTAATVFNLLPRMIEVGPRVFTSDEWIDRRRRLKAV
jgi:hypothetical protein